MRDLTSSLAPFITASSGYGALSKEQEMTAAFSHLNTTRPALWATVWLPTSLPKPPPPYFYRTHHIAFSGF